MAPRRVVGRWRALISVGLVAASAATTLPAAAQQGGPGRRPGRDPVEVEVIRSPKQDETTPTVPEGRSGPPERGPEPTRVAELAEARTATSDTWTNSDGSRSVTVHGLPHYFQPKDSSEWLPIDTAVVPDEAKAGRVRSKANEWSASFGTAGPAEPMQQLDITGRNVGFAPLNADPSVPPVTEDSTVTYTELWPATDAVYEVSPVGTDERLVLKSAKAPTTFGFDISGATPTLTDGGGVDLAVDGEVVATIPAPTVDTAQGPVPPDKAGAAFAVKADADGGLGRRLDISISPDWLAGLPPEAFPVVIDPTVFPTSTATQTRSIPSYGSQVAGLRVGRDTTTGRTWRAKAQIPIPDPAQLSPGGTQPWHLISASLRVYGQGQCYGNFTVFGTGLEPQYFASVLDGSPLPTSTVGGQSCFHQADVTDWVAPRQRGSSPWYGFIGDELDQTGATHTHEHLGTPSVEYRYFQSPDPNHLVSPSGTISTTTPTLQAADRSGGESGQTVYYDFKVSTEADGRGTVVDSGWINQPTWEVPPGALADGMTYYVRVLNGIGTPWWTGASDYVPPAAATVVKTLVVKQRLGAGGPSPSRLAPGSHRPPTRWGRCRGRPTHPARERPRPRPRPPA